MNEQGIDVVSFLERAEAGPMHAWVPWQGPVALRLTYISAEDVERVTEGRAPFTDDENREFYLALVTDWRGLADKQGQPLPFDREVLRKMWRKWPTSFRLAIQRGCQQLEHFLKADPSAGPLPPGDAGLERGLDT